MDTTKPEIPIVYYMHCPVCNKMADLLIEDMYEVEEGSMAYQCKCGVSQQVPVEVLPKDERSAYELTINNLLAINHRQIESNEKLNDDLSNKLYASELRFNKLGNKENLLSSVLYTTEKGVDDILKLLEENPKDVLQRIKYEAEDLKEFTVKEQDKAKNNETEIEEKTEKHWKEVVQEIYKETPEGS